MTPCGHFVDVPRWQGIIGIPPSANGCEDCLPERNDWIHLRRCLQCGRVLCCNSSPQQHAQAHAAALGHPLVQSFEPEEDWVWCYLDGVGFEVPQGTNSPSHDGTRGL